MALFSIMGRDTLTVTRGPAMPGGYAADSVVVASTYDDENRLFTVARRFNRPSGYTWLFTNYRYSALGALIAEINTNSDSILYQRDLAGNVVARNNRRQLVTGTTYDAMNRPRLTVQTGVQYTPAPCVNPWTGCAYDMPTRRKAGITLAPDSALFGYDLAGRLTSARNRSARIARAYTPGGTLAWEEQRIRTALSLAPSPGDQDDEVAPTPAFPADWYGGGSQQRATGGTGKQAATTGKVDGPGALRPSIESALRVGHDADFEAHVYRLQYHYDLDGRRDQLIMPSALAPCPASPCSGGQGYGYNALTGTLDTVTDAYTRIHTLAYDLNGRLTTSQSPGWSVTRAYDDANRLTTYNDATLSYDAMHRVTYASDGATGARNYYDGLGHLRYAENETVDASVEQFGYDGLGNRVSSQTVTSSTSPYLDNGFRYYLTQPDGRVNQKYSDPANWTNFRHQQLFDYDAAGNAVHDTELQFSSSGTRFFETASYFDAADRMRIYSRHVSATDFQDYGPGSQHAVFEEYAYDALGRRVAVRSRRDYLCSVSSDSACDSFVKRYVWDGDQMLHEIRAPGSDSTARYQMDSDALVVTYTHIMGIDAPAAVMLGNSSMIVPHLNWRGVIDSANAVVGALPKVAWPGASQTLDQAPTPGRPHQLWAWYGDLTSGGGDGSGLKYMRNRYYDPAKGTFTQEDPIGLAGGLNTYGYAGGDPVNFADPFGLWPTGVHDWLIARALAKVAGIGGVRAVQDGSRGVDAWRGQFGDRSFQHSMKNAFESASGALERRNQFVSSKLSEARSLEAGGDHEGALGAFGAAIHPLMDSTSPWHTNTDGSPRNWSIFGYSAYRHAVDEGNSRPTAAQRDATVKMIQDAYTSVFGKP